MFVLAAMAAIAVASLQTITLNMETANAHKKGKNAFYSAEVGLDLAVNDIISEFENLSVYSDSGGFTTPQTYRNYQVSYNITNPLEPYLYQTIVGNSPVYHYAYTYDIEAESTSLKDSSKEHVEERIRILETPLVQYYVFYGGSGDLADLEIHPGPAMTSWGRIHANRDIYVRSGNKFTLQNFDTAGNPSPHSMVAGGKIIRGMKHKNTSGESNDSVRIKTSDIGTTINNSNSKYLKVDMTSSNEDDLEGDGTNGFKGYLMINEKTYDVPSQSQFRRGGFYEGRAEDPQRPGVDGIKIVGTGGLGTGNIEVYVSRPSYTNVTDLVLARESSPGVSTGLPLSITETTSAFRDCREDRLVDTTNIDLNLLQQWYIDYLDDQGLSLAGDGILIYTSRSPDASFTNLSGNLQAIRLMQLDATSAPQLSDETTVATDNPMYAQGDFNTINTQGVALISDAMNILSNNFTTRAGACTNGSYPTASNTSFFAAIFSGYIPTPGVGNSALSGGLHNYPRFNENWQSRNLNIRGSLINLWKSTQAIEQLECCSMLYKPPNRLWGWDVRFQDPNFWPPFIPSIFSVERVGFFE